MELEARVGGGLGEEGHGFARACRLIILDPDFLYDRAEIDVRRGLVRVDDDDGRFHWEREVTPVRDWQRLRSYVASRTAEELVRGWRRGIQGRWS